MRILTISVLTSVLACGVVAPDAFAQKGVGQQQGVARQVVKPELVTLSGVVLEVKSGPCPQTTGRAVAGTHLVIQTEDGATLEVHVGPQREVESLLEEIQPEQAVTVVGFRTDEVAEDALVAKSLEVNDQTIKLRDDSLRPVWAGGQGRGQGRGRGQQATAGQGRGRGAGMGQGQGRGQGFGRGRGQGRGSAFTAGQGAGWQQGLGRGMQRGQGRGFRGGQGQANNLEEGAVRGRGMGQGRGQGCGFCGRQGCRGACQRPGKGRGNAQGGGPGRGQFCPVEGGQGCAQQLGALLESQPKGELSPEDRDGLLLMREEEKLAHDVYVTLGKSWDLRPFQNIPWAETQHMDAVKMLLDRYDIEDPITDMTVGVFQSEEIQGLYDKLVDQGKQSVEEAIKAGALIEELDIADLQRLVQEAKSEDLRTVYETLLRGSRNHLRAFARQLQRYNMTYEAKHLSQEEFDRIAAGAHERGMPVAEPEE